MIFAVFAHYDNKNGIKMIKLGNGFGIKVRFKQQMSRRDVEVQQSLSHPTFVILVGKGSGQKVATIRLISIHGSVVK